VDLNKRGYLLVDVDPSRVVCEWWHLNTVATIDNGQTLAVAFQVRDGQGRLESASPTSARAQPPALAP
jgi:hypothetical protein